MCFHCLNCVAIQVLSTALPLWSAKDEVCLCLPLDEVAPFMALCVCVFASEDDKGIKT